MWQLARVNYCVAMSSTDAKKSAYLTLLVGFSMGKPKIDLCLHFAHLAEASCLHLLCYVESASTESVPVPEHGSKAEDPSGLRWRASSEKTRVGNKVFIPRRLQGLCQSPLSVQRCIRIFLVGGILQPFFSRYTELPRQHGCHSEGVACMTISQP